MYFVLIEVNLLQRCAYSTYHLLYITNLFSLSHCESAAFVFFSEQTAIIYPHSIQKLVFVMEVNALCLAGTKLLIFS
jgi:hypothetical protein